MDDVREASSLLASSTSVEDCAGQNGPWAGWFEETHAGVAVHLDVIWTGVPRQLSHDGAGRMKNDIGTGTHPFSIKSESSAGEGEGEE